MVSPYRPWAGLRPDHAQARVVAVGFYEVEFSCGGFLPGFERPAGEIDVALEAAGFGVSAGLDPIRKVGGTRGY